MDEDHIRHETRSGGSRLSRGTRGVGALSHVGFFCMFFCKLSAEVVAATLTTRLMVAHVTRLQP